MIPEKAIREEKYTGYGLGLSQTLDEILMSTHQRNRIQHYLDEMETVFREANS